MEREREREREWRGEERGVSKRDRVRERGGENREGGEGERGMNSNDIQYRFTCKVNIEILTSNSIEYVKSYFEVLHKERVVYLLSEASLSFFEQLVRLIHNQPFNAGNTTKHCRVKTQPNIAE